jgi:hypothetical protein
LKIKSKESLMNRLSSFRPSRLVLLLALALFLLIPAVALAQGLAVPIEPQNDSTVRGVILLTTNEDATDAALDLIGFEANAEGTATLLGGTCDQPSASFAPVAEFTADADGNVRTTGTVLFQNENVALADIADGSRIISISVGDQVVACGVVPTLPASASEDLPAEEQAPAEAQATAAPTEAAATPAPAAETPVAAPETGAPPTLPGTGGTLDYTSFALFGVLGFAILFGGLVLWRKSRA